MSSSTELRPDVLAAIMPLARWANAVWSRIEGQSSEIDTLKTRVGRLEQNPAEQETVVQEANRG